VTDDTPVLIYLEADDEVTTVVRRLRQAGGDRVVLIAPGRSRATSSLVALRLLARVGEESGLVVGVVGDPLTRSLATEAGLETYVSADDARRAVPAPASSESPRRAAIHVMRGGTLDETAPVNAVGGSAAEPIDDATMVRPVPVMPRSAQPAGPVRRRWRVAPVAAVLAAVAILVAAGVVLGAVVLPAATIVVMPRTEPIGPFQYELEFADAQRDAGTVRETATVTASGTYDILEPAVGTVTFFNWNAVDVEVPPETLVATGDAAGEQAFSTLEGIVVPAGTLTPDGRIQAGDASVGVVAAAAGPAGNVAAEAIDTVLNAGTAARLRGFPNNPEPLVINPEATSGGMDDDGSEIVQADVDAAMAALRAALGEAIDEALGPNGSRVSADAEEAPEPTIEGLDGLVGVRDQPEAEISGTLEYDRRSVERAEVVQLARERLALDPGALPADRELLADATQVAVGAARIEGDRLIVAVTVSGASMPQLSRELVLDRVRGRSAEEAEAALSDLGAANVGLWPDWVASVPELDWRIDLQIEQASTESVPASSSSP
jgi:hypothetical protein